MPGPLGRPLPLRFYLRDARDVARDLIGCRLVHRLPGGQRLVLRLTEVEAYLGDGSDPASHAHVGPTPRNRSMFGPAGRVYAYRSYGIHTCINVVCEPAGRGAAVLLRAAEPVEGAEAMARLRGLPRDVRDARLSVGPGRLARALGLDLGVDGACLRAGPLTLHAPDPARPGAAAVGSGPRIGITRATALPYRYFETREAAPAAPPTAWVSRFRSGTRRRTGPAPQPGTRRRTGPAPQPGTRRRTGPAP